MTRLLDFIEAADAVGLKQAFDDRAMEKVSTDLECMKVEVAQNYFNKPEVTTEEVVDEGKKKKMSPEEMDKDPGCSECNKNAKGKLLSHCHKCIRRMNGGKK